ncbi:lipid-binding protein [Flavobacterium agrisoli]|uniref:Uncharacterized protein n=1 Tax=Flavobacterium agrisoli TaxID=2793066 RepID=A0A934PPC8_9FLAO|nr:lipid-binding protein [Flavobacterium agrisoli]MBK0370959.1 hypothetical protein [Flavobacterium agrisoli]
MKNLKQNITKAIMVLFVLTVFSSCDETGSTDPGGTSVEKFAGEWYISLYDPTGAAISEHDLFDTYNTAANDGTMWLDDHNYLGKFKIKATTEKDGTFSANSAINEYNARTVTITEGKVEQNAATSKGGHTVDKISFNAEFSDEPGVIYYYEGHRRTGFYEDEY